MKVVVTGAAGIVGQALENRCPESVTMIGLSKAELSVTDREAVLSKIGELAPDVVIHAGAYTDVDGCETNADLAYQVNGLGTRNIAEACRRSAARLIYFSTDYVFDGSKRSPYLEDDPTGPLSLYGRSKLWGEVAAREQCPDSCIVRTQWVFGPGGKNFVDTMLKLGAELPQLKVVDDQHGAPTFAGHIAEGIFHLLAKDPGPGTYHLSAAGATTWYGFAREIFRNSGLTVDLIPCTTDEFPRPAPRPAYGVLRNYHLELSIGDPMPSWQEGLRDYLALRDANPESSGG